MVYFCSVLYLDFQVASMQRHVFCSDFACYFIGKLGTTEFAFKTLGFFYRWGG